MYKLSGGGGVSLQQRVRKKDGFGLLLSLLIGYVYVLLLFGSIDSIVTVYGDGNGDGNSNTFVEEYNDINSTTSDSDIIVSEFGDLLVLMLTQYSDELEYSLSNDYGYEYYDYCFLYDKSDEYVNNNISLTELKDRYLAYINSSNIIIDMNEYYNESVYLTTYKYNETSANYTFEIEYANQSWYEIQTTQNLSDPFGFNVYSDYTDDEFYDMIACSTAQLSDEPSADEYIIYNGNNSNFSVTVIGDDDSIEYNVPTTFPTEQCGAVQKQESGDCASWASSNQFMCNYNAYYLSTTSFIPQCFASVCYPSCQLVRNGETSFIPTCMTQTFVMNGICPSQWYSIAYPGCLTSPCSSCATPGVARAVSSFVIDVGGSGRDKYFSNWKNANIRASKNTAFVITVPIGKNFHGLKPSTSVNPIDRWTLCGLFEGFHSMTVVGTSTRWDPVYGALYIKNSWGTDWGAQGYFYLPVDTYVHCMTQYNTNNQYSFLMTFNLMTAGFGSDADDVDSGESGESGDIGEMDDTDIANSILMCKSGIALVVTMQFVLLW